MTDIVVHTFKDHQVRTAVSSDGEPLFNLGDVAAALEIKDSARLASRLEDDLRQTHPILDRLGRTQNATFITEAGLYEVVLRSDKPEAKPSPQETETSSSATSPASSPHTASTSARSASTSGSETTSGSPRELAAAATSPRSVASSRASSDPRCDPSTSPEVGSSNP